MLRRVDSEGATMYIETSVTVYAATLYTIPEDWNILSCDVTSRIIMPWFHCYVIQNVA
jgi:hypothetical protein